MVNERMPVHPDDVLFFTEVTKAMRAVAKKYELPLTSIEGLPMPEEGMADRLGDCTWNGRIRLVLRCTVNGDWCAAPMSPQEVWNTATHELAHLRHMNHGTEFLEFEIELQQALGHQQEDHKAKVLDRLVKLQKAREGEAQLGNIEAAEAFATAINRMLIEYELNPSAIDYARSADSDPVIEVKVNWKQHMRPGDDPKLYQESKKRIAWQETLARVVSDAHLCSFLINAHSDTIWFVGTKSHATVAEYVYSTLVLATYHMAKDETRRYTRENGKVAARGFKESWFQGFISRIHQRFQDARKAAIVAVTADLPGSEPMALMRLNGALIKVQTYIENRFKNTDRVLKSLHGPRGFHFEGRAMGTAAANRMPIGRKGVDGAPARKKLT